MTIQANARLFDDESGVPALWKEYTRSDFEKIVQALDFDLNGCVDLKEIMTILCLLDVMLPAREEMEQMASDLQILGSEEGRSLKEHFLRVRLPVFETNFEIEPFGTGNEEILRNNELKLILWDLYAEQESSLAVDELVKRLELKHLRSRNKKAKTYGELIFFAS